MSEGALQRIEEKLNAIVADVSTIKQNQAADLQRFVSIDRQFVEQVDSRNRAIELHAAQCPQREKTLRAQGAAWGIVKTLAVLGGIVGWIVMVVIAVYSAGKLEEK